MTAPLDRRRLLCAALAGAFGTAFEARAQPPAGLHIGTACGEGGLDCASAVTPAFDARGRLWLACLGSEGTVSVLASNDRGKTFGRPLVLARHGTLLDVGPDTRPAIAVDARGRIAVAYGVFAAESHANSQIMVSTSADGGASFSTPRMLSRNATSQRFPTLVPDGAGGLFAAWIDQRAAAPQRARELQSALGYAWSRDGGASFETDRVVPDTSCDCCAPAVALDAAQRPVLLYRNVVGRLLRDHAVVAFSAAGTPGAAQRVAADRWEVDGCPHHGPALAVAADGSYHAAWFTLGAARKGLFYARSANGGRSFTAPKAIGDVRHKAGRPVLLAQGDALWLAWREFDGQRILVKLRASPDAGRSWSPDRVVGESGDAADNPRLVSDGERVHVSWMTRAQGYWLIDLHDA